MIFGIKCDLKFIVVLVMFCLILKSFFENDIWIYMKMNLWVIWLKWFKLEVRKILEIWDVKWKNVN